MLFCFERIHVVYLRYVCLHKRKGIKPLLRLYAFMCMLWFDFVFSKIKRKFVSESGFVPQIVFLVYQKLKVKSRCNFNFLPTETRYASYSPRMSSSGAGMG